jgi:hypothetical protein
MEMFRKTINFAYFYRRRLLIGATFCTFYGITCKKSTNASNELFRMAIAGSLANLVCEGGFHFADTVNVRAKVSEINMSSLNMVKYIY